MQLSYIEPIAGDESSTIKVVLDEGETLGHLSGPVEAFVPTDLANADYADIVANDYPIESWQKEATVTPRVTSPPPKKKR
jgi:hypothetical protein